MLPQNVILFIALWSFAAASPIPSVMINSHGTIINETSDSSTNNQNGFNEGSFDEANLGLKADLWGVMLSLSPSRVPRLSPLHFRDAPALLLSLPRPPPLLLSPTGVPRLPPLHL
ncbi:hypothetical protein F5H01DRAFT_354171 [Linnemannia elongata]|nr:hypothetical protein F5H01DRAFT_354171 [Linnemannia elongata]